MDNLRVLLLLFLIVPAPSSSRPSRGMQLQSHYLRAVAAYRRLERTLPREELRALTGIGLLNGARQAEQLMEEQLVVAIKELLLQTDMQQSDRVLPKIDAIEQQLTRDQRALDILSSALDVLSNTKDDHEFRLELRELAAQQMEEELLQQELSADITQQPELGERLGQLRRQILKQVPQMKVELDAKIEKALRHLLEQASDDGVLAKAIHRQKVIHKRAAVHDDDGDDDEEEPPYPREMRIIKSILTEANHLRFQDDFRENLVEQQPERRIRQQEKELEEQDQDQETTNSELDDLQEDVEELDLKSRNVTAKGRTRPKAKSKPKPKPKPNPKAKQEVDPGSTELMKEGGDGDGDDDDDLGDIGEGGAGGGGAGGGGGLVGIIGSLSGGEGGSDVGALIGALTGVVSTLFGPGGLDIETLISSSTSLLSGLLSGNKNFGTVLGQYVGTAFDGLSGGGGAVNNGQFLGNFLGTVVASLSADPEEEGPPQPLTFAKSLLSSFLEAKFRPAEASEERHDSAELPRPRKKKEGAAGGFDSGGFVKQVASHLVSSALGLLLNAALGASGGASTASKGIFSSSSSHSSSSGGGAGGGGGHHWKPSASERSWAYAYDEPF
ncbi:keratin, type I cytoskeletal 9 [Drosophila persimilis]|uniref:keratin, type I cytoskeletal 9 n=1 Tax=Drosophila persimilis TaxID=7234 RepID=UPI000F07BEA2|nr:keratin, type I cytoskeletal 9 [Drosophila persimilis]